MRVTILTNGPGELWGWVRPVVNELRKRGHSVSLWLLPCQFASGHEREAASLLGVDKLEGPMSAARLWHLLPDEKTDCVLQLGGDLIFGWRIANAAKAPLACYTYGFKKGLKNAQVFTAFYSQLPAVKVENVHVIGDLVKDALALDLASNSKPSHILNESEGSLKILFLPGSRPLIRKAVLPWLVNLKFNLQILMPEIVINTLFPPFVPDNEIKEWRDAGLNPVKISAGVAMANADFAITQPGTNTLELMHSGLPALVAAPESFLDFIPVSGVKGFLASMPLIGRKIKHAALLKSIKKWNGFISLPNRIAGQLIMDEMYGDISVNQVAERVVQILKDKEHLAAERNALLNLSSSTPDGLNLFSSSTPDGLNLFSSSTPDGLGTGAAARLCDAINAL